MPVLREWNGSAWVDVSGAPGPIGPTGPAGAPGAGALSPVAASTATTAVNGQMVLANAAGGAFVLTLPAVASGAYVVAKKIDATTNAVTVTRAGTALIDGATTFVLDTQWESITLISNGTDWFVT